MQKVNISPPHHKKKRLPTPSYESNAEFNVNVLLYFSCFNFFLEVLKNIKTASTKISVTENLKVCHLKI